MFSPRLAVPEVRFVQRAKGCEVCLGLGDLMGRSIVEAQ